jgi:hypothetical protein
MAKHDKAPPDRVKRPGGADVRRSMIPVLPKPTSMPNPSGVAWHIPVPWGVWAGRINRAGKGRGQSVGRQLRFDPLAFRESFCVGRGILAMGEI